MKPYYFVGSECVDRYDRSWYPVVHGNTGQILHYIDNRERAVEIVDTLNRANPDDASTMVKYLVKQYRDSGYWVLRIKPKSAGRE